MKAVLRAITRTWDRLWFAPVDPYSAALFRIAMGILLVAYFVANYPNWEHFFAADGVLSLNQVDPERRSVDRLSLFHWTGGVIPVGLYWWLGFFGSIAFTVGWQTRVVTVWLFLLVSSMVHRNLMIVNGEDLVFRMALLYSCFAPLGHELSLDRRRRDKKGKGTATAAVWPLRLLQINVALVYALSLPNKFVDDPPAWLWEGTAIYWTMTSNLWTRWPWPELFYGGLLSKLMTYGTVLTEGLFPILVWIPRTKLFALATIVSMHLGIAVVMKNVTFFSLSMVCCMFVFLPPELARRCVGAIHARSRRGDVVAAAATR